MELYTRQAELGIEQEQGVIIVGCGGVGVWAALALALAGVKRLTLFDADELSVHNLNRLPFPASEIGKPKSLALASWLQTLRPEADIQARGMFDPQLHTVEQHKHEHNWVVCATDSLKSRQLVYKWAGEIHANYLELGADGERWTLAPKPPQFSTELELEPGYQSVPVHVGPCMMAGAAAAYYILHYEVPQVSHLGDWIQPKPENSLKWLSVLTTGETRLACEIEQGEQQGEDEQDAHSGQCEIEDRGFICTLPVGHEGAHEAHGISEIIRHTWEGGANEQAQAETERTQGAEG